MCGLDGGWMVYILRITRKRKWNVPFATYSEPTLRFECEHPRNGVCLCVQMDKKSKRINMKQSIGSIGRDSPHIWLHFIHLWPVPYVRMGISFIHDDDDVEQIFLSFSICTFMRVLSFSAYSFLDDSPLTAHHAIYVRTRYKPQHRARSPHRSYSSIRRSFWAFGRFLYRKYYVFVALAASNNNLRASTTSTYIVMCVSFCSSTTYVQLYVRVTGYDKVWREEK